MSENFNEYAFRQRLENAQTSIQRILSTTKAAAIQAADEIPHKYSDKYFLAEQVTKCGLAAVLNTLLAIGLTPNHLEQIVAWSKDRSVTIELSIDRTCKFDKETTREEESANRLEVERTGFLGGKTTVKTVTKITEYHYLFHASWTLRIYRGTGRSAEETLKILSRESEQMCVVRSKSSPYSESSAVQRSVELGWLLRKVSAFNGRNPMVNFEINRSQESCYTPRRNEEIEEVLSGLCKLSAWCHDVDCQLSELFSVQRSYNKDVENQDMNMLRSANIFVPVLGLFEEASEGDAPRLTDSASTEVAVAESSAVAAVGGESAVALRGSTVDAFMAEQQRSLDVKLAEVQNLFDGATRVFSGEEAKIVTALHHLEDIVQHYIDSVNFIESMLRKQLIAAIGKEVQPSDFSEYMVFHSRKLFKDEFQPRAFSQAVRRTVQHSPEGSVSIEASGETSGNGSVGGNRDPIMTMTHSVHHGDGETLAGAGAHTMEFSINASTKVRFNGERHVHGWMGHRFSNSNVPSLSLVSEARQFSSFIVLVGRISSATSFDPKHAFIIQNKDRMVIPLLLETIPTPKEFKDAIESLSPEQQRFAKAFRAMQLESTLFAVCIVQIKPQLEKVLNLHADSLTKEIKLTQDLMKLFIDYQIPSDLLSFEGAESTNSRDRIEAVKRHVGTMNQMIDEKKNEEVSERNRQREYDYGAPPQAVLYDSFSANTNAESSMMRRSRAAPMAMSRSFAPPPAPPAASGGPVVQQSQPTAAEPSQPQEQQPTEDTDVTMSSSVMLTDYTKYPVLLDQQYEKLDRSNAVRPTIIKVGPSWSKASQKNLLAKTEEKTLYGNDQDNERKAAFDLLDALSRSGGLVLENVSLHVVIAATHTFDDTLMTCLVQKNMNPIERVERSLLIMGSVLHGVTPLEMLRPNQVDRIRELEAGGREESRETRLIA